MAEPYINSTKQRVDLYYVKMISVTPFYWNSTINNSLMILFFIKWLKFAISISSASTNLNIRIRGTYVGYSIAREIYLFVYTLIFANILYFILNNEIQNKTDFCFAYVRKKDINMRIGKLHLYPFFFHYIINHYYHCG